VKTFVALLVLLPTLTFAQTTGELLVRDPGTPSRIVIDNAQWSTFLEGGVFATHVSESGPKNPRSDTFSTNWVSAGAVRSFGDNAALVLRVRGSLEPLTIKEKGYPQLLQYVSPTSGGPLFDSMRAHDLIGEASADFGIRTGGAVAHIFLAPVGEPPLGPEPFERRESSADFAEAPYAYDIAESYRHATRLVGLGITSRAFRIDGGVYHDAVTTGRHSTVKDGDFNAWSVRAIVAPAPSLSLQVSYGDNTEREEKITSASASWTTKSVAVTAGWTRRAFFLTSSTALGIEGNLRLGRSTLMARVERADRPVIVDPVDRSHVTLGYIFDLIARDGWRAGLGANVDYHTKAHDLPAGYGHKPQGIYVFARVRTTTR
jgi:hypothetical protein